MSFLALRRTAARRVVVINDPVRYKATGARRSIKPGVAMLLYNGELSPNETAFSKLKAQLRKAAERSVDALIATLFNQIPQNGNL